ncbi:MAG: glycosyltransferase family 4 protein [Candidatus Nanopelagicales bacterium]|nr:glycosyltransferase family 4 protein [Candidatus Nanopelagicales bacterium]MDZ4248979.1 glycosyltransferase family 4 protein [Candidatus Nanopelagicales bacterium]
MTAFSERPGRPDLLVVTPMLFGSGGCAVYYTLLTKALVNCGYRVTVVSERLPRGASGLPGSEYIGLLTPRSSVELGVARNAPLYALNNLELLRLGHVTRRVMPRSVLIHTGLLNRAGPFRMYLPKYAQTCRDDGIKLVADARDNLLPEEQIPLLDCFDEVVCCSLNVVNRIEAGLAQRSAAHHIPVMFDLPKPDRERAARALARVGCHGPFLLYVGALKDDKGVSTILKSFHRLQDTDLAGYDLVLAGPMKRVRRESRALMKNTRVKRVGAVPHRVALGLMEEAACCVNVSPSEGMPRASLEAMGANGCVVLPPGIPEFEAHAPAAVCDPPTEAELSAHLTKLGREGWPRTTSYPLGEHAEDRVIPLYEQVLF